MRNWKKILSSECLTESLIEEIIDYSPSLSDGISDDPDVSSKTYPQVSENKCRSLFRIGRRFANYNQLVEFVPLFLKYWEIAKQRDGMTFKCFYAQSTKSEK